MKYFIIAHPSFYSYLQHLPWDYDAYWYLYVYVYVFNAIRNTKAC